MAQAKFTPTEQRIFNKLADLEPHTAEDLLTCLPDELSTGPNLHPHITGIRNKIAHLNITIMSRFLQRKPRFQIVGIVERSQIEHLLHNT